MVRTLLRGDALRVFNNRATTQGAETVANLTLVVNALGTHVFPVRALVKQERSHTNHRRCQQETSWHAYLR